MRSLIFIFLLFLVYTSEVLAQETKPNLVIIHTDEHNFRTLGCYRDLMEEDQAYVWGKGVEVKTPNIDRLAKEGAICTDYYATSPVCSPSRASMLTGLYPVATGVYINDYPLRKDIQTFAQVLKKQGYATSYVGKWHLIGAPSYEFDIEYNAGFDDNRYMMTGGHAPYFHVTENGVTALNQNRAKKFPKDEIIHVTDFFTNKSLEILERDKNKPFCLMLSIPDPHTPDYAPEKYAKLYADLDFKLPKTSDPKYVYPVWASNNNDLKNNVGNQGWEPNDMMNYFGMVKQIDDNVGRILKFLDDNKLTDNTIVIFTSDHGDMCYEHNRRNKGIPYEASARIPFVIRYPNKIRKGKVIEKAYTNADFTPTILGIMGMPQIEGLQHGINDSEVFTSRKKKITEDRTVFVTTYNSLWGMVTNGRYKLITSLTDEPWLMDLMEDPDELINFYENPKYREVRQKLKTELSRQMRLYTEPYIKKAS